jgi:ribosome biogenesis GTPase
MTARGFDVDDHEQFDRPRRRTRPRTKDRPTYPDAVSGLVIGVDRGRYTCVIGDEPDDYPRVVTAMKSRPLGRQGVVVGDRVRMVGDVSAAAGSLARIVEVEERKTVLRRTADDEDPVERVLVANAEQLVIVAALAHPEPSPRLIDRCLVAAYDAGLDPLLCLTKPDLAPPDPLVNIYRPLGVPYVVTERGSPRAELQSRLVERVSVLVGSSGVGKSTLVNALVPGTDRAIAPVNTVTGRGRHTSTSLVALRLPEAGWVIDTPGIRSFGLAHVDPRHLIEAFPDLAELTATCPRGCTHGLGEPECGLDEAIADGRTERDRVESYRRLLASREGGEQPGR